MDGPPEIAVDAMGGDDAPDAIVRGASEASRTTGAIIELVGEPRTIQRILDRVPHVPERVRVVPAEGAIPMDAKPEPALAAMPNASLPVAVARVGRAGGPRALVTAGNTSAVVLACARGFGRLPGVRRTALAAVIPTEKRRGARQDPFSLLLDAGATLRVTARDLAVFAIMGAAYSAIVSRHPRPRVALLSNGTEPTKGPPEVVGAHPLIEGLENLEFIGNIESLHLPRGTADVVVCDGFTGNITLKMLEGVSEVVTDIARYAHRSRFSWRLALWLLRGGIRRVKELTDWQQYGGAPILGFDRLCIKAHGRSGPRAIRNAIRVAERCLEQDLVPTIAESLAQLGPPASPDESWPAATAAKL
jgi:glycerol-3-phosphate acyltransferase PlsX